MIPTCTDHSCLPLDILLGGHHRIGVDGVLLAEGEHAGQRRSGQVRESPPQMRGSSVAFLYHTVYRNRYTVYRIPYTAYRIPHTAVQFPCIVTGALVAAAEARK